jgi:hypothetical protein
VASTSSCARFCRSSISFASIRCSVYRRRRPTHCSVRKFGGVVCRFGGFAIVFGFEQLPVQTGETLDHGVLVWIERDDLVVLGVVDETFFSGANLLLQFGDSFLKKVAGGAVGFSSLFEI